MRTSEIKRTTAETDIALSLNLDGTGKSEINTVSVDNNQATSAISEDYADQSFRFQQLYYALDKLDEREKAVIVLHYFEDKSIKEIASILQIASGTVKYYLSTGRNHLKELLQ